jgi:hypothetical protein
MCRSKDVPFFWFDLATNNQNATGAHPFDWYATIFFNAVKHIGHTLFLYGPWEEPAALKRSWCLFELYATVANDVEAEVIILGHASLLQIMTFTIQPNE